MKNSRLFKVFTSLCMIVGMLFSVKVVKADDKFTVYWEGSDGQGSWSDIEICNNSLTNDEWADLKTSLSSAHLSFSDGSRTTAGINLTSANIDEVGSNIKLVIYNNVFKDDLDKADAGFVSENAWATISLNNGSSTVNSIRHQNTVNQQSSQNQVDNQQNNQSQGNNQNSNNEITFYNNKIVITGIDQNVVNELKGSNVRFGLSIETQRYGDNVNFYTSLDSDGELTDPTYDPTTNTLTISSGVIRPFKGFTGTCRLILYVNNSEVHFEQKEYTIPSYNCIVNAGTSTVSSGILTLSFNDDNNYKFVHTGSSIDFQLSLNAEDNRTNYNYSKTASSDTKSVTISLSELQIPCAAEYNAAVTINTTEYDFGTVALPISGDTQATIASSDGENFTISSLPTDYEHAPNNTTVILTKGQRTYTLRLSGSASYDSSGSSPTLSFNTNRDLESDGGGLPEGDYTAVLSTDLYGNTKVYKLNTNNDGSQNAVHFKKIGNGPEYYENAGRIWMHSNDPADPLYIIQFNPEVTKFPSSTGHKFTWIDTDGNTRVFYSGLTEYTPEEGEQYTGNLYKLNVNNISNSSYVGTYKKSVELYSSNGGDTYIFHICDGYEDTAGLPSDLKTLYLKPQVPDHKAACKLVQDSDMTEFTLHVECRESQDGSWNPTGNKVTGWMGNQTYSLELTPDGGGNKAGINFTGAVVSGDGTITFNRSYIDYNSFSNINGGKYRVRLNAIYFDGIQRIFLSAPLYAADGRSNLIDFGNGNIVKNAPQVTITENNYGVKIACVVQDPYCAEYLNKLLSQEKSTGTDRSELRFYKYGSDTQTGKPFVALSEYGEDNSKNLRQAGDYALEISKDTIEGLGLEKGTLNPGHKYGVEIQTVGYERQSVQTDFTQHGISPSSDKYNFTMSETNDGWSVISITGDPYKNDYFDSVTQVTFNVITGYTTILNDQNSKVETGDDGRKHLYIKSDAIVARPTNNATVNIYSNKYPIQYAHLPVTKCTYSVPGDLSFKVETGGLRVYSSDQEYLKAIKEIDITFKLSNRESTPSRLSVINGGQKGSYDNATNTFFIPLSKENLDLIQEKNPNNVYCPQITARSNEHNYSGIGTRTGYSFNPISFAGSVQQAATAWINEQNPTGDTLYGLDNLATLLQNGYVVNAGDIKEDASVSGMGVDLYGAVAGAISTDNQTIGTPKFDEIDNAAKQSSSKQVSVERTVDPITADVDTMISELGLTNIEKTGVEFDIHIYKDTNEIVQLPFGAMLRIRMPQGYSGTYYLLTKHTDGNGRISYKKLEVQVEDGIGIAYTDQFSSFALVKDPSAAPAPSKKDSSSKSSSTTTTTKTDSVVTCQMAGYPSNYAWNEAAKACQPGYINDNGVFVSTAGTTNSNRVKAVNTWDNGLGGSITALIASTMAALFAAYALRKWN